MTDYRVTGMTCAHCEAAIREEVSQVAGVDDVSVSAATGLLHITGTDDVDDAEILAAVDEAGYTAERL
ncbi:heavy-metal-associated domain-containing protein [Microbacterium koreense]|uniref:Heavy-metal-associated domain-containing protein n=1 Tax=Microbacterium koreense TaxID=323761 RepID=A0ABW2ZUH4_9MICO